MNLTPRVLRSAFHRAVHGALVLAFRTQKRDSTRCSKWNDQQSSGNALSEDERMQVTVRPINKLAGAPLCDGGAGVAHFDKGLIEGKRPPSAHSTISVWLAAVAVLGTLALTGCGGGSGGIAEVNQTPNVTAPWDAEDGLLGAAFLALPDNTITIPYNPGFTQLGRGYFSMPESYTRQCFTGEHTTEGPVTTSFHFEMADSRQDVLKTMGFDVSASGGFGLFKASAAFQYLNSLKFSAHTVVAVSKYEILGETESFLGDPNFTPPTAFGPQNAYALCGDYYVHSIQAGGTLYAIITIEASSTEQKNSIASQLKASFGNVTSVESSYNSEFAQTLSQYNANIEAFAIGCKPLQPVTNWDEYLAVLRSFQNDVTACQNKPSASPVTATLSKAALNYQAEGITPTSIDDQRAALDRLINFSDEYQQLNNDLDNFRTYVGFYDLAPLYGSKEDALAAISAAQTKLQGLEKQIQGRIDICANDPYHCVFFTEDELPTADYPGNLRKVLIPPESSFFPASCEELENGSGSMADGEYTLYFGGEKTRPFKAYCSNMSASATEAPKTYLTLNNSNNFAQFKGIWKAAVVRWFGTTPKQTWPNLRTNYEKVRLDVEPDADYIDVLDDTYANNTSEAVKPYPVFCDSKPAGKPGFLKVPYGIGARSNSGAKLPSTAPSDPVSMIDLRGTKFRVSPDEHWDKAKSYALVQSYSTETIAANRQTVSMQVMGNVGVTCPSNYPLIKLEYCSECSGQ